MERSNKLQSAVSQRESTKEERDNAVLREHARPQQNNTVHIMSASIISLSVERQITLRVSQNAKFLTEYKWEC